ncbi:MAG: heparinase II/III family protein, partial [Armatimonadota bacterium]
GLCVLSNHLFAGGWDKATIAHNTLTVDQKSQSPAEGKSLAFGSSEGVSYTINDAGPIYPGVRFVRTVAMIGPNVVVFLDQVKADAPHTFDIAYHQIGVWDTAAGALSGTPWAAPDINGYKFLKDATIRSGVTGSLSLQTRSAAKSGAAGAITIAGTGGESIDVITGYGLRKSTEDRVPMLIMRRQAMQTAFLWAVSLDGSPVTLRLSSVKDGSGMSLATDEAAMVQVSTGKQTRLLLVNPDRRAVQANLPTGESWKTDQPLMVRYEGK